jgi:5'-methylthioadenosine phosphorylase
MCASSAFETPWGEPSGALRIGEIEGLPVVFLPRHDKGHRLSPSDINLPRQYRCAEAGRLSPDPDLALGLRLLQGGAAARQLRAGRSVRRSHPTSAKARFFGKGLVAHVSMAHPVSPAAACASRRLRRKVRSYRREPRRHLCLHRGAAISTLAESLTYQQLGYSVIGMTNMPEAEARARGGDLLRDRRDGDRFRLLASRP